MQEKPVIVNYSGVLEAENLPVLTGGRVVDCRDLEGTNCYCDPDAEAVLAERFSAFPTRTVHWIDSGDYHYASKLWTDRIDRPFDLVVADHHPDMQPPAFGDILSCGGWVRSALESNPCLRDVWLVGIHPELKGECGGFPDRVHIVGEDVLPGLDPVLLAGKVRSGRALYLSVDKDVLRPEDARTDWDQGTMSLDWLCAFAAALGPDLCGVDICGALPVSKGGRDEDFSVNSAANRRFHELFSLYL